MLTDVLTPSPPRLLASSPPRLLAPSLLAPLSITLTFKPLHCSGKTPRTYRHSNVLARWKRACSSCSRGIEGSVATLPTGGVGPQKGSLRPGP